LPLPKAEKEGTTYRLSESGSFYALCIKNEKENSGKALTGLAIGEFKFKTE